MGLIYFTCMVKMFYLILFSQITLFQTNKQTNNNKKAITSVYYENRSI